VSALDDLFARCREEGRAAVLGYLPVGFPSYDASVEAMLAMVDAGVDAIEIGMPYSDPLMEGPVIQAAHQAALEAGTRQVDVLRAVEAVAATGVPTVVMGYWNPVHRYGFRRWAQALKDAGGAGAITPDLIPEEAPSGSRPAATSTSTRCSSWRRAAPTSGSRWSGAPTAASSTPLPSWG
jgi:tryptophan synthase alpha chain